MGVGGGGRTGRKHDIVVIGASAGGLDALTRLCSRLPASLPAVTCIVQHTAPSGPGMLAQILARHCPLPVVTATDGAAPVLGHVYVAPPDRHLLIEPGRLRLVRGPRENLHRPAIDPLFRSAAVAYGARVIGVVLTGMLDDGTAGLQAIHQRGGTTMVQDPEEAAFRSMPDHALAALPIDHCLPIVALAAKLVELVGPPGALAGTPLQDPVPPRMVDESAMAKGGHNDPAALDRIGQRSSFTCPECHGTLWELGDDAVLRYRCHLGHAYTGESLNAGQTAFQERALWTALRALEEQASLLERLSRQADEQGSVHSAARFRTQAQARRDDAEAVRRMLTRCTAAETGTPDESGAGISAAAGLPEADA